MRFYLNVKRFDKIVKDLLMEMAELLFDTIFMDVNVVLVQLYSDYVRLHKVTTSLKKLVPFEKKNPGSVPDVHEYKAKYYIIWYSIN